jgi:transposase
VHLDGLGVVASPYRAGEIPSSFRTELIRHLLPLIPADLLVEQVLPEPDRVVILSRPKSPVSTCPLCGVASGRVHSHYLRTLADLPWQGRLVALRVQARRFRCATRGCPRRVFAERLPEVTAPRARRTARLADIQRHIGLALGGEAGSRLAHRLTMPVGATTLLAMLRRGAPETPTQAPRVLGVDDWAWRRGRRYGTILVDLERRRVVDLLPDRRAGTLIAWLRDRPGVEVISRDRGGTYADAARRGAPEAVQVSDRWHLLENCSRALLDVVRRRRAEVRAAAWEGAVQTETAPALPPPMTSAERRHWERWRRQRDTYDEVVRLRREGLPIKEIVRRLGIGRNTARRWLRGSTPDPFRPRRSVLEPHRAMLERRWAEGCHNGAQLWRELRDAGFRGGLRVVTEWATRQRLAGRPGRPGSSFAAPPLRRVARMLTADPSTLQEEERQYLGRLLATSAPLALARDLALRFAAIVRERREGDLDRWLADAAGSEMRSFADGLRQDEAAVRAALELPWSNGQTEGQITRLKLVKRQMFGRAKLDLLRARVLEAA